MATSKQLMTLIGVGVTVLTLCGGALVYVNDQYNDLLNKQQSTTEEHNKLYALKVQFEKDQADSKLRLVEKKNELDKKEQILKLQQEQLESEKLSYKADIEKKLLADLTVDQLQLEAKQKEHNERFDQLELVRIELNQQKQELENKIKLYNEKISSVEKLYKEYSSQAVYVQIQLNAEKEIFAQMSAFSKLGVNLKNKDWCDKEYTNRYYQAEGILSQISSISRANGLYDKYESFLLSNGKFIHSSDDGVCKK
ncbi:hypothetical protein D3H41_09685 [Vibrio neocaledonicus]|nr:hypothetical protein D3H41_09685 [Vibrio neocaledonicus]